ncbi:hypothetical protein GO755_38195 [Spirosoma sp. HMF4905]|uniref:Uncharacterized protein n=1 Tax=Spirosoma arboris TaxID=2682092 RepID=A0A7K1SQ53_9BACT|nr:hypothetical protein [Spirosoma arboris]MVM35907.1 hypothetical protein [Spirosoma arboris]
MKSLLPLLLLLLSQSVLAQTNYVANTANATNPTVNNTLVGADAGISITSGFNSSFFGQVLDKK